MNSFFFFSSELIVNKIIIVSIVVNKFFSFKKLLLLLLLLLWLSVLKFNWKQINVLCCFCWFVCTVYLDCLKSPYYKFLRDTLSYFIMLSLHYALCLSPSTIAFSGLEWTILVFYVGRFVAELKQIFCIKQWLRHPTNETLQCYCSRIFSVYRR